MAVTKKHIAIQAQKRELANGIERANAQLRICANKVPEVVLNGSHQLAVAWKEVAESIFKRELSGAPERMSVSGLQDRLAEKQAIRKSVWK